MLKKNIFWGLTLVLCCCLLSLAVFRLDFNNYDWLPADNPIQEAKKYLDTEFQYGEDLVIIIRPARYYFLEEFLEELHRIYQDFHQLDYVKSVNSPLHAQLAIEDSEGGLSILSYRDALEQGILADINAYRQDLIGSDYWGRLIARDVSSFLILVKIDIQHSEVNYQKRAAVISSVKDILIHSRWLRDYQLAGESELMYQLDSRSKANLLKLLPIVGGITFLILWLVLRSFLKSLVIMLAALFTLLISLNVTVYNHHPISVVSLSLPILIIVIAMADSIHIVARWERLGFIRNSHLRIKRTLRETWLPCLMTSATTAVGFGVFYFSELIPLRYFGMDAFISVLLAYPIMLLLTIGSLFVLSPLFLRYEQQKEQLSVELLEEEFLSRSTQWLQKYPALVIAMVVLVSTPIIYQLRYAYTETNFLDAFFYKNSEIYQAFNFLDEELSGSGAMDIILQGPPGQFEQLSALKQAQSLTTQLSRLERVNLANSYLLPIALVHRAFSAGEEKYPFTQEQLAQELLFLEFSRSDTESDVLSPYLDFDYANTRINLQTPNLSSVQIKSLLTEIWSVLGKFGARGALITGMNYYFQSLSDYVLSTQIQSFLLCLILVWLFFVIRFGGMLGTLALLTNIFPLGLTLGIMVLLDLPFDFATVLVASVSLGLCIDNTVHYLHYYKLCMRGRPHIRSSLFIPQVSMTLARPILLTSGLLIMGFGVLILADLVILARFGFFAALAIAAALLSVFIFLPAALTLFDRISRSQDPLMIRKKKTISP